MKIPACYRGYFKMSPTGGDGSTPAVYGKDNYSSPSASRADKQLTLRYGGKSIYLPYRIKVSVGSSPNNDIFINDARIAPLQATLFYDGQGLSITHLAENNRTLVADKFDLKSNLQLENRRSSVILYHSGIIAFEIRALSLPVIFEVDKAPPTRWRDHFRMPDSLTTSAKEALARRAERHKIINGVAIDPAQLMPSDYAGAKSSIELVDLYLFHLHQIRKGEKKVRDLLNLIATVIFTPALIYMAMTLPYALFFMGPLYAVALLIGYSVSGSKPAIFHPTISDLNHNFLALVNKLGREQKESIKECFKYLTKYLAHLKYRDTAEIKHIQMLLDRLNKKTEIPRIF